MKETNDKIVQEYIERALKMCVPTAVWGDLIKTDGKLLVEIAKMIQLQDFMDKITTIKK